MPSTGRLGAGAGPLVAQAVELLRRGRHGECENLLRVGIAAAPADHAALHLLGVLARERGENARAVDWLRQAIAIEGRIAPYHGNLGNAYLMSERFEEAAACYRRALELEPDSLLAHFGLGMAHLGLKAFPAAARELEIVVKAQPNHVDACSNLGTALSEFGRHDDAIMAFERALALKPDSAGIHFKFGMALRRKGDLPAACRHLARAAVLDPRLPEARYQVGVVLHALDRLDDAVRALDEALKLRPGMVPALYERGQVLNRLQDFEAAADCFERGLNLDPNSPLLYHGLARTRHLQGRCEEARLLLAQALAKGGDTAECHTMLGLVHQSQGDFDAAIIDFEHAIASNPAHGHAHLCLALISESADPTAQVRELERVRDLGTLDTEQRASLAFALGSGYEKMGDTDAAFASYRIANDLRHAQFPIDIADLRSKAARLRAIFGQDRFANNAGAVGSDSERPVFVVGMPRSGTTLGEQILASHPQVHGHGELDGIRKIEWQLPRRLGGTRPYPECITALSSEVAVSLAGEYLARLEQDAPEALRSVDKMPHNFERLGLIALLFPRARVIHCMRDPVDTCLSNYFHDFVSDHRHTYDLDALGRFYRYYAELMAHWRAVLPISMFDVSYEALVGDQEGWSRKLVDFLGLPWDERCLAFYQSGRPVYTYSLWQVRQPIYSTSIQRWRPYAKHLGPLFDALEMPRPAP